MGVGGGGGGGGCQDVAVSGTVGIYLSYFWRQCGDVFETMKKPRKLSFHGSKKDAFGK